MSEMTFAVGMHHALHLPEAVKFALIWLGVSCLLVATELAGLYLLDALN